MWTKLRINFASATSDDWLKLEQVEFTAENSAGFMNWIEEKKYGLTLYNAFQLLESYKSHCTDEGCIEAQIKVHKSRQDLAYTIFPTYGELSERFVHTETHTKNITVMMESSASIEQMISSAKAVWEGPVLDQTGAVISPPAVSWSGDTLSWGIKVAGTLRVTWTETHDAYVLTLKPREEGNYDPEDLDTAYESTIFATYGTDVENLEIDLPDLSGNCKGGVSFSSGSGDDDDDEDEECVRHVVVVDPCTGEIKDEYDESMACPEAE